MRRGGGRNREAGLTLIELLITIVVASLVAGSTFVFFAGQQHIYETQTKLLNVQQNLWMAMEVIARGVRASSGGAFAGCTTVRAYRSGVGMITMGGFIMTNGAAGAPDTLTLGNFTGGSGNWVDTMLNATMDQDYPGSAIHTTDHKPFRENEFILVLDTQANPPNGGDRGCTVYQVTNVPGNSDVLVTNPTSDWNATGPVPGLVPWDYTGGSGGTYGIRNLGTFGSQLRYFIDSTGAPAVPPRLMVDDLLDPAPPAVLAEGIEDLQVSYACDLQPAANPDGALAEGTDAATRLADEWVFNQTGDVVPANCALPTAVRITLVGRSLTEDIGLFGTSGSGATTGSIKPAVEDGVAGAPDAFRHRTLSTTIFPRN